MKLTIGEINKFTILLAAAQYLKDPDRNFEMAIPLLASDSLMGDIRERVATAALDWAKRQNYALAINGH